MKAVWLALVLLVAGCAGYRGGWESVAYLGEAPPQGLEDPNADRTYDTQVYLFVLPLGVDPRNVYPQDYEPGKTRVHVNVVPQAGDFVFTPSHAVLKIGTKEYAGAAGYDFGKEGGKWEHRPVGTEMRLTEVGRQYLLSIDFPTPVPSPESRDIVLDLSRALRSPTQPPLPTIKFAPARWKEGYT